MRPLIWRAGAAIVSSMKVTEHLARATGPTVTFEIIPPQRGGSLEALLRVLEALLVWSPPYLDVTSHAAETFYDETSSGIRKSIRRKRPGTLGLCALIQNKYGVDAVPHVVCRGFQRQETEDFLIELRYLGIDNVLAVRGDAPASPDRADTNPYGADLVAQIANMNHGKYLEDLLEAERSNFCIGVGGYPEKHCEAPNIESDILALRDKVRAGADYIVTQMFFDNSHYFDFVRRCRDAGIEVPIIPGLKVLTSARQLHTLPQTFHLDIPTALAHPVAENPQRAAELGIEWAQRQVEELFERGAPSVHFYVMQSAAPVSAVLERLGMKRAASNAAADPR